MAEDNMASDRVSIYLPAHLREIVGEAKHSSLSGRIAAIIDRYGLTVARHRPAFGRAQWCLIFDALNGWASWAEAGQTLMLGVQAEVADHIRLNDAGTKWDLTAQEQAELVRRLGEMTPAETIAVVDAAEWFWLHADLSTDEAMAKLGIA